MLVVVEKVPLFSLRYFLEKQIRKSLILQIKEPRTLFPINGFRIHMELKPTWHYLNGKYHIEH